MKGLVYFGLGIVLGALGYKYYSEHKDEFFNNEEDDEDGGLYKPKDEMDDDEDFENETKISDEPAESKNVDYGETYKPEEDIEEEERKEREMEETLKDWHKKHDGAFPEIVTPVELPTIPAYVKTRQLTFYHEDETLVDDETNDVVDINVCCGDCLEMYDNEWGGTFLDNQRPLLYVINYSTDTLYEIHRVMGKYDQ